MSDVPAGFTPTEFKPRNYPVSVDGSKSEYPYFELEGMCIECPDDECVEVTIVVKKEYMSREDKTFGYNICGIKAGKGCRIRKVDEEGEKDDGSDSLEDSARSSLSAAFTSMEEED